MKKKLLLLAILASSGAIQAQVVNIPDPVFKNHLFMHGVDTNNDGEIQIAEAAAFNGSLFLQTIEGGVVGTINNLTGIEAFPNITALNCKNHNLTGIDLSNNTKITVLNLDNNELASINLSNNNLLTFISVNSNNLAALDVSNCPLLVDLSCSRNQLISLNVSNNPVLKTIWAPENFITSLNTTSCPIIEEITVSTNELTSINTTGNTMLKYLFCQDNNLTSIDVSTNMGLTRLSCGNNSLTSLDISSNVILEELNCGNSEISSLNLANNPFLTNVGCYNNLITTIDVSGAPNLKYLSCGINMISSIDVSNNPQLIWLQCQETLITTLDVSTNHNLTLLSLTNNQHLTYINAKNGNNHNMQMFDHYLGFMPELEMVCVDEETSDFAEYVENAVHYPVEITENCVTMGLVDRPVVSSFTIFPNPVQDVLQIHSLNDISEIKIYNAVGQMMLMVRGKNSIDMSGLADGLYSLKIDDRNGNSTSRKIVKQ